MIRAILSWLLSKIIPYRQPPAGKVSLSISILNATEKT